MRFEKSTVDFLHCQAHFMHAAEALFSQVLMQSRHASIANSSDFRKYMDLFSPKETHNSQIMAHSRQILMQFSISVPFRAAAHSLHEIADLLQDSIA